MTEGKSKNPNLIEGLLFPIPVGDVLGDVVDALLEYCQRERPDLPPEPQPEKGHLVDTSARDPLAPCDSMLEWDFLRFVTKWLSPHVLLYSQRPMRLNSGLIRCDFVIESSDKTIVVELDGRDYHDKTRDADLVRDLEIVEKRYADVVWRVDGRAYWPRPEDLLWFINDEDGPILSERGNQAMKIRRSDGILAAERISCYRIFERVYERDLDELIEQRESDELLKDVARRLNIPIYEVWFRRIDRECAPGIREGLKIPCEDEPPEA